MLLKHAFGYLASAFAVINLSLYIVTILRGKTRPHALSWLLWAVVMAIVSAAQFFNQAGAGSWQTGTSAIMCGIIGVLALFYGERKGTPTDWLAIIAALGVIPVWIMTKDALLSVILLTIIDALGFYPTYRKGFHLPYEENQFRPFRAVISFGTAILAIEHYDFTTTLYPASMMAIEFCLGLMLIWRRRVGGV